MNMSTTDAEKRRKEAEAKRLAESTPAPEVTSERVRFMQSEQVVNAVAHSFWTHNLDGWSYARCIRVAENALAVVAREFAALSTAPVLGSEAAEHEALPRNESRPDVAAERVAAEYVVGDMLRDPDIWRWTMHVTFINGDLNAVSLVPGTVAEVAKRIIEQHAPNARRVSRTYPIDWPTSLVYEDTVTLDDGYTAEWRHIFRRPDEPWRDRAVRDRAAALTSEQSEAGSEGGE